MNHAYYWSLGISYIFLLLCPLCTSLALIDILSWGQTPWDLIAGLWHEYVLHALGVSSDFAKWFNCFILPRAVVILFVLEPCYEHRSQSGCFSLCLKEMPLRDLPCAWVIPTLLWQEVFISCLKQFSIVFIIHKHSRVRYWGINQIDQESGREMTSRPFLYLPRSKKLPVSPGSSPSLPVAILLSVPPYLFLCLSI